MSGRTCEDCGTELGYVEEGAKVCDHCDGYREGQKEAEERGAKALGQADAIIKQLNERADAEARERFASNDAAERARLLAADWQRRAEAAEAEVVALKTQYLAPLYPLVAADRMVMVVERMSRDKLGLVKEVGKKLLPLARHVLAERRRMAELLAQAATDAGNVQTPAKVAPTT